METKKIIIDGKEVDFVVKLDDDLKEKNIFDIEDTINVTEIIEKNMEKKDE